MKLGNIKKYIKLLIDSMVIVTKKCGELMLFHFFVSHFRCMGFHLPSQCTLEAPPAGKCCKVPKCPPNYIINLPPGYVQE